MKIVGKPRGAHSDSVQSSLDVCQGERGGPSPPGTVRGAGGPLGSVPVEQGGGRLPRTTQSCATFKCMNYLFLELFI